MKKNTFINILLLSMVYSCANNSKKMNVTILSELKVFAREPKDSEKYRNIKYDFYNNKDGELFERKLAYARDTNCNCEFEVYYDNVFSIFSEDTVIYKPLNSVVDINTFTKVDSSSFSKDKRHVYFFFDNSDGGIREIVEKADPITFKSLYEYRWGIDKNYVFYKTAYLPNLNIEKLRVLSSPDSTDPFVKYVKDDKLVFYENTILNGADARTFKVVANKTWDAEDKNQKYNNGNIQK